MWVAEGCVRRFREDHQIPKTVSGWIALAERIGMEVIWTRIPFDIAAFRVGHIVMVNHGLTAAEEVNALQHEVAHWSMHRGNALWWGKQPMGEMLVAKMERQANEFAGLLD